MVNNYDYELLIFAMLKWNNFDLKLVKLCETIAVEMNLSCDLFNKQVSTNLFNKQLSLNFLIILIIIIIITIIIIIISLIPTLDKFGILD